jgi:hypothetical protein
VYASDMKKMIKWYKAIKANNVEIKLSEALQDDETDQPADNDHITTEEETKVEEAQEGHS